jgi:hypothetical protein
VPAAAEFVEQDPECEREDPLCDPDGEPGTCLGEVLLESHLALEVGQDALDHQRRRGGRALAGEVGGGARLVGVSSWIPSAARRPRRLRPRKALSAITIGRAPTPLGLGLGDRFGASRGRSGSFKGRGAASGETSRFAGKAHYQAPGRSLHGKEGVDGSSPSEGFTLR